MTDQKRARACVASYRCDVGSSSNEQATLEGVKLKINSKDFRVPPGKKVELDKWPTTVEHYFKSKEQYQELLASTRRGA